MISPPAIDYSNVNWPETDTNQAMVICNLQEQLNQIQMQQ